MIANIKNIKSFNKSEIYFLVGGKKEDDILCLNELEGSDRIDLSICTENGSIGCKGRINLLCQDFFKFDFLPSLSQAKDMQIFACGPLPMLDYVANISSQYNVLCQISLDRSMACGIGVCQGCAIKVKNISNTNNYYYYKHVCKDGPVFDAKEIIWEELV
ncbi:MAG: hypothetical protein V1872_04935 [bacterium]